MKINDADLKHFLVGRRIEDVLPGQDPRQSDFILVLDDGMYLDVHAVGDDMTYIEFDIEFELEERT